MDGGEAADIVTTYDYDLSDFNWADYGHAQTRNNRLLHQQTVQGSAVLEETWYEYTRGGHIKRIPQADPVPYSLTCMNYDSNQHSRTPWLIAVQPGGFFFF